LRGTLIYHHARSREGKTLNRAPPPLPSPPPSSRPMGATGQSPTVPMAAGRILHLTRWWWCGLQRTVGERLWALGVAMLLLVGIMVASRARRSLDGGGYLWSFCDIERRELRCFWLVVTRILPGGAALPLQHGEGPWEWGGQHGRALAASSTGLGKGLGPYRARSSTTLGM
jgi:hypothetical protein